MLLKEIESRYFAISEKIKQIFPHIESISIFFQLSNEFKYLENGDYLEVSSFLSSKLTSLKTSNLHYQWMLPTEILELYEKDKTRIHQLDLLSEHENRLLLLNFKSEINDSNDLVCLTFPKEIRFLGLYKSIKNLTTEDKILIGELLYKVIEVEIETQKRFINIQRRIAEYYKLKEDLKTNQSSKDYCKYIKTELNLGLNTLLNQNNNFDFNQELIDYILKKNYSIKVVCDYLKESYDTVKLIEKISDDFRFQLFHFQLIENEKTEQNPIKKSVFNTNDKIIDLLDKLERAAETIESKGLVVNGKIIAQYLAPPVSPPAITDILKKNIVKIENKLKEFPSKWLLIRKYLKPLRELEFKNYLTTYNQKVG